MRISLSPHGLAANRHISVPQRQSGNSVDPGTNRFSIEDILAPQGGPTCLTLHVFRELNQQWSPVNLNSKGLSSTKEALVCTRSAAIQHGATERSRRLPVPSPEASPNRLPARNLLSRQCSNRSTIPKRVRSRTIRGFGITVCSSEEGHAAVFNWGLRYSYAIRFSRGMATLAGE